jgi:integrase
MGYDAPALRLQGSSGEGQRACPQDAPDTVSLWPNAEKVGNRRRCRPDCRSGSQAQKQLAKVALGIDPAEEKQAERAATALSFEKGVEEYLNIKRLELRKSSLRAATLYLKDGDHFRALHKMPLRKVSRSHVSTAINKMVADGHPGAAGRAHAIGSAFYTWAMVNGHCDENPFLKSARPKAAPPRSRVLSHVELAAVWKACGQDDFGRLVKLLVLTGARREEIAGLRWSEIVDRSICLPAERVKNKHPHTIPLSTLALRILETAPRRVGRDFVFADRSRSGFTSWKEKAALDARLQNVAPWTLHGDART